MNTEPKEKLLVCCGGGPEPFSGSEPGKGFSWTMALSRMFEVHVVCTRYAMERCEASGLCDHWIFHPHDVPLPKTGGWRFYASHYLPYCRAVIPLCRDLIAQHGFRRLFQPTMGTFRMIPQFEKLGIDYYLGPLGGGEFIPRHLLVDAGMPVVQTLLEKARPWLNRACVRNPLVRRTLSRTTAVLATTEETRALLMSAGVRCCHLAFPDVVDPAGFPHEALKIRNGQRTDMAQTFRLIFSARGRWWKGGQLAIGFVDYCRQRNLDVRLTVVSDGPVGDAWKHLANQLQLADAVDFLPLMPRQQLFDHFLKSHAFIYPTMHDSSSSALPEAYGCALPSLTLGLGGIKAAACDHAGVNTEPNSIGQWMDQCHGQLTRWQQTPQEWLAACASALDHGQTFHLDRIEASLQQLFKHPTGSSS
jgi:glycosyltransferase involved in cell wall biosynthesis